MDVFYVTGTHYELGLKVGTNFRNRIEAYFAEFTDLRSKFVPFLETVPGRLAYSKYLDRVRNGYPHYYDEIRGIADGSKLPFQEVFAMHIRTELQYLVETAIVPECSTVFVDTEHCWAMLHNEDTSAAVYRKGYVIVADVTEPHPERFVAFCYPGIVPGNCFSANRAGLVVTVNALYADVIDSNGLPRQLANRAMLSATDPGSLEAILSNVNIATSCSVNVAWFTSGRHVMLNYELTPKREPSRYEVGRYYAHFNAFLHEGHVAELPGRTVSSQHRKSITLPVDSIRTALELLGNTDDAAFPIFRRPNSTDIGCTVATGVFDLNRRRLDVYIDNPIEAGAVPILELDLVAILGL